MSIRSLVALSFCLGGLVAFICVWLGLQQMLVSETEANLILLITLGASSTGALVSFLLLHPTVRSLQKLSQQVKGISMGNFTPIADIRAPKELKSLAGNFNQMLETLEESFRSLSASEAEKSHLIAQLGHDIKTPLAALKNQVEALHDGVIQPEEVQFFYQQMEAQVDRLTTLTNQLMEVALVERENLADLQADHSYKEVKLDQALLAILAPFQLKCQKKQQQLLVQTPDKLPTLFCDELKLHRILDNLLDNAGKYSPEQANIELTITATDTHVHFTIKDNGVGIATNDLPFIFNRLYRVDKSRSSQTGGSGLGLYISKTLAEQMGGTLTVESQLGQGSSFILSLPLTSAA